METTWPLQDAKNRLGELLETARKTGAQTITRYGKPIAVVVSAETYARLQPQEKLVDILQECPAKGWQSDRDSSPAGDVSFQ